MCVLYYPNGALYNANGGALPNHVKETLREGDELRDDEHLPIIYPRPKM